LFSASHTRLSSAQQESQSFAVGWRDVNAAADHDLAEFFVVIGVGPVVVQCDHPSEVLAQPQGLLDELGPGQCPGLVRGTRLAAEGDLAEQWGIAYMTVRRMMAELRERGVVVSQPGKGTYVL